MLVRIFSFVFLSFYTLEIWKQKSQKQNSKLYIFGQFTIYFYHVEKNQIMTEYAHLNNAIAKKKDERF